MFHIERLVHAAGDFDTQVLVDGIFWNFHFVPFGELCNEREKFGIGSSNQIESFDRFSLSTLDASGVGRRTTRPSSLSSRANMPSASAKSFILTRGNGCVVVKSPWVSHLNDIRAKVRTLFGIFHICFLMTKKYWQMSNVIEKEGNKNIVELLSINRTCHWHGFRSFRLVRLQFLAAFHFHGAVDNPVGCQRLQPFHFHDNDLSAAKVTPSMTHETRANKERWKILKNLLVCGQTFLSFPKTRIKDQHQVK